MFGKRRQNSTSTSTFLPIPQSLNPSIPQFLNPSIPQSLNSSIPAASQKIGRELEAFYARSERSPRTRNEVRVHRSIPQSPNPHIFFPLLVASSGCRFAALNPCMVGYYRLIAGVEWNLRILFFRAHHSSFITHHKVSGS